MWGVPHRGFCRARNGRGGWVRDPLAKGGGGEGFQDAVSAFFTEVAGVSRSTPSTTWQGRTALMGGCVSGKPHCGKQRFRQQNFSHTNQKEHYMRRKILMGVLALALPLGTVAGLQTAAVAKKAPPNPITCTGLSGVVVFPATETIAGTVTTAKKSGNTNVTDSSVTGCTGGVSVTLSALSILGGKNAKNHATPHTYLEGQWSAFITAGLGLKKSLKTVTFNIGTFKTSGSAVDNGCAGDELGFTINGTVTGTYATAKKAAVINACLGADTRLDGSHGFFGADLNTDTGGGVVSADIDPATSNATL